MSEPTLRLSDSSTLRVVIDTNVLVASLFGGRSRRLLELWRSGALTLCLTDAILGEYLDILTRFTRIRPEVASLLAAIQASDRVLFVTPTERLHAVRDDPDDDKFLECAVAAQAAAIISTDQHLLALDSFRGLPILPPERFLELHEAVQG